MLNKDELADFVSRATAVYAPLGAEALEAFLAALAPRSAPKGKVLVAAGSPTDEVYLILQGALRFYYLKEGEERIGHVAFEGEFLSAYPAFLSGGPSPQYLDALEDSELLVLRRDRLLPLYDRYHEIERFGRRIAESILVGAQERAALLLLDSAAERYEWVLRRRPLIAERLPQYMLADYLGIRPETLSRVRSTR